MEEFTINKFIKLRLEDGKTVIYVNDERFDQCKFLLLDIPVNEMTSLNELESIDDAIQKLDHSLEQRDENGSKHIIPPEVEFWGHCSNLQVWYENNYNTKLLHRNLAFPLLWELTQIGDTLAEKVFAEEIAIRLCEGNKIVREFLRSEGYLGILDTDQFYSIVYSLKFESFSELLKFIGTYFIDENDLIAEFFDFIDSFDNKTLKAFLTIPEEATQVNLYQALVDYLGKYRKRHPKSKLFRDGFKKIGSKLFNSLKNLLFDNHGYIDIFTLENLVFINCKKTREFLYSTKFKFKFGFIPDLWDFQYILNVLLRCFDPEELIIYLEERHKEDLLKNVLPKIIGFRYLKMSDLKEIDMKQFITAFFLEEAGAEDYRENIRNLGDFLADSFLSELIDRNNEVNEEIIRTLAWVGGEARTKLINRLHNLFDDFTVKKYFNNFREYFTYKHS
jgi:hypothetical protein